MNLSAHEDVRLLKKFLLSLFPILRFDSCVVLRGWSLRFLSPVWGGHVSLDPCTAL